MIGNNNIRKIKQGKPKTRKPYRDEKFGGSWRITLVVFCVIVLSAIVGAVGGFSTRYVYSLVTTSVSFKISKIEITGNKRVAREDLIELSGIEQGNNIFSVDVDDAAKSIQSNPWIKGVTVKRHFPDKIMIHVEEWNATAILRRADLMLMDESGEPFKTLQPGDPVDLPIITIPTQNGPESQNRIIEQAFHVMKLAKVSSIVSQNIISEVVAKESGIQIVGVNAPYLIKLDSGDIDGSWAKLENVLADAQRSGMEVLEADVRYRDGIALMVRGTPKTLVAENARVNVP